MPDECIDVFCHFLPPGYCEAAEAALKSPLQMFRRAQKIRVMVDLDARLELIGKFPGYRQVISLASPPIEALAPSRSAALARTANDELAKAAATGGDLVYGFVASLPMNAVAARIDEASRGVKELGAAGVQVFTNVGGRPLDDPQFEPLWELLERLDRPVLLHPARTMAQPDYAGEEFSKFDLWWAIGWPLETTLAMARLAISGIFDRHRRLKVVAHHVGGFMPMLAGRLGPGMELLGTRNPAGTEEYVATRLQEPILDACARFVVDTASFGSRSAIECGLSFFGADQLLFATDMPFDPGQGPDYIRSTLAAIDAMSLTEPQRQQILAGNARKIFHLRD